jgi:hypothetical protein
MNIGQALAMLDAFASVGVTAFDVTLTSLEGEPRRFRPDRGFDNLQRTIGQMMQEAERDHQNVILRPRCKTAALIQLDDLTSEMAGKLAPLSFMVLLTSPGNCQAWIAVKDAPAGKEAAKEFSRRLRKGAGADPTATGATRIAGSLNFKTKYAPAFPLIEVSHINPGNIVSLADLEKAGVPAAEEPPPPPASVPRPKIPPRPATARKWPEYQQSLGGAPRKPDGSPDRSMADFMWCKWAIERGWSIDETAAKLLEVSPKAQENANRGDKGYALLTAGNAAKAVDRDRGRQQLAGTSPRYG